MRRRGEGWVIKGEEVVDNRYWARERMLKIRRKGSNRVEIEELGRDQKLGTDQRIR